MMKRYYSGPRVRTFSLAIENPICDISNGGHHESFEDENGGEPLFPDED